MSAIIIVIAIGVSMVAGRYIIGAIQTQNEVNQISNASKSKTSEPLIPVAEARTQFMTGCDTGSYFNQTEYCECVWEQLVTSYGVNAIMNDGLTLTESEINAKYERQINYCLTTVYENIEL
jgi:hypothetical protein